MMAFSSSSSTNHPRPRPRLLRALLLLTLLLAGFPACHQSPSSQPSAQAGYPMRLAAVPFTAELAVSPREMTTGLMHRAELPPEHGMLFVYQDSGRRSFWMKNTHIPLDLGFFTADGILREIYPLHPNDLTPVTSLRADIAYALEMNRGWFSRHGLQPGAQLDLELVRKALSSHGANP